MAKLSDELLLMARLERLMETAKPECRERIVAWFVSRYGVKPAPAGKCNAVPLTNNG